MTILHIITGLDDGGAEAVLFRLCRQDTAHRHHVISLLDSGKYGPLLESHGIAVSCLGMKRGRISLAGLWRLWRLIRKLQPDVVQTWMYHADLVGGVVARLSGQRNIIWGIRNGTLLSDAYPRSTIVVAWLCARLSRAVPRRIVCCGEQAGNVHAALGYEGTRMTVIHPGFDLSVFHPDPKARHQLRRELALEPTEPMIGFVARYHPMKDHNTLLRALAVLRDLGNCPCCLLIGTGMDPGNAALTQQIDRLGLGDRVRLLGRRTDIPALMNALDLHVMSSESEAFGNVLGEAMACGTPCVSTDVGDAAEIIGSTGRIVPVRDPEALADAIAALLAERETSGWLDRREAARSRIASRYTLQTMVERYHEVWFEGVETAPLRGPARVL